MSIKNKHIREEQAGHGGKNTSDDSFTLSITM